MPAFSDKLNSDGADPTSLTTVVLRAWDASGQRVFVAVAVMLEVEWVLRSAYGYAAPDIVHALRTFGGLPTVEVEDSAVVSSALDLAKKGMDLADALHLRKSAHCVGFATFDRNFLKAAKTAGYDSVQEA
nr:type II toxin-antitoxin system VapC family toxin [Mesorhizobium ciceri]